MALRWELEGQEPFLFLHGADTHVASHQTPAHHMHSWCYIPQTLDCWAAGPTPQAVEFFLTWLQALSSLGNICRWVITQNLHHSVSWALRNL